MKYHISVYEAKNNHSINVSELTNYHVHIVKLGSQEDRMPFRRHGQKKIELILQNKISTLSSGICSMKKIYKVV